MNQPTSNDDSSRREEIIAACREAIAAGDAQMVVKLIGENPDLAEYLVPLLQGGSTIQQNASSGSTAKSKNDAASTAVSQSTPAADHTVDWNENADGESPNSDATFTHMPGSSTSSSSSLSINVPALGSVIGGFRLIRQLGRGGMGVVFEAEEVDTKRRLALKMLSSSLPRTSQTVDRFMNEASLAASLAHPRTTFVYGAGEADGKFFISMELMPGDTLKDLVEKGGPRPIDEAIDHVIDMLDGLQAAHASNVIHRDLKPSNCFVDVGGRVKIGDFGLAKSLVQSADITQTGSFIGTPQFAAPEQIRHADVDQRTDIFSVGATLYYLLTGTPPYTGDPASVIAQIVADPPPRVRQQRPEVPKTIEGIIVRCMSKAPKKRYQSASELRQALMPFSSRAVSVTDIGRRMAAMFIDLIFVIILTLMCYAAGSMVNSYLANSGSSFIFAPLANFLGTAAMIAVPYFAFFEWLRGSTPAKRWLGIRVANAYGETPSFWRALLRAAILPGLFLSSVDIAQSLYLESETLQSSFASLIPNETLRNRLESELFLTAKAILALICCSTMRERNGYRGLHEWISGTRIVRTTQVNKSVDYSWLQRFRQSSNPIAGLPERLGRYRVLGHFCNRSGFQILEAFDEELSRKVWLYLSSGEAPTSLAERAAVPRATRQRWLERGVTEDGQFWLAIEAVDGGPVTQFVDSQGAIPWAIGRMLLADLADELEASVEGNTLPPTLSLDQIWLDHRGRLRLLDFPLTNVDDAAEGAPFHDTEMEKAWRLFREVAHRCRHDLSTPGEANDYLTFLLDRQGDLDLLRASATRFRDLEDTPFEMGWDNRLAMLAVTLGFDLTLINTWSFICSWVAATISKTNLTVALSMAIPATLLLPAILGWVLRGGVAFALSGFQIRVLKSRKTSRWRSSIRSLLVWSTVAIPSTIVRVGFYLTSMLGQQTENANPIDPDVIDPMILSIIYVVFPTLFLGAIAILGFAISILSPRRGLQDRVLGTYVVHS